jgi:hypothetical protein
LGGWTLRTVSAYRGDYLLLGYLQIKSTYLISVIKGGGCMIVKTSMENDNHRR